MLGVLFGILRIAGCIILILLILILVIVAIILFDPVRYRMECERNEQTFRICAGVTWIFGLIRVKLSYPDPGSVTVKAGPATVFERLLPGGRNRDRSDDEGGKEGKAPHNAASEDKETDYTDEGFSDVFGEPLKISDTDAVKNPVKASHFDTRTEKGPKDTSKGGVKVKSFLENISGKARDLVRSAQKIGKRSDYYIRLFQNENTKKVFAVVRKHVGKVIKNIRPRRISGHMAIGTGSPDTTGYVMAIYGILYPYLGKDLEVKADFENAVIAGDLSVKGHITLGIVAYHGIRLGLDRRLRQFINRVRKGGQING